MSKIQDASSRIQDAGERIHVTRVVDPELKIMLTPSLSCILEVVPCMLNPETICLVDQKKLLFVRTWGFAIM